MPLFLHLHPTHPREPLNPLGCSRLPTPPRYRYSVFSNLTGGGPVKPREAQRVPPPTHTSGRSTAPLDRTCPAARPPPRSGGAPLTASSTNDWRYRRLGTGESTLRFPAAGEEPLLLKGEASPVRGDEKRRSRGVPLGT